jgi:Flp pilus assembly protein TadG
MTSLHSQRAEGQTLVLVALAFILLVACLGLALDGANAFGQRRRVSNADDAASLAATRELVTIKRDGRTGQAINNTIREFLVTDHSIDAASSTWHASYVTRDDPDTIIGPVVDDLIPPSDASGVRIDLSFTFKTFFMSVFGRNTLTVGATSTSTYGPLGTAMGEDLIPLGISDASMSTLLDMGHVRVDLKGTIMSRYGSLAPGQQIPAQIADVVTDANFANISLSNNSGPLPNANGCQNPNVTENLTYWWCNGTPNQLQIGRILPSLTSNWGSINSSVIHRVSNRPTAVVPVYTMVSNRSHGISYQLTYFVAVDMSYSPSDGVLTMTLRTDYVSAGAAIGAGSGVETGAWAVNLKR